MEEQDDAIWEGMGESPLSSQTEVSDKMPLLTTDTMPETEAMNCNRSEGTPAHPLGEEPGSTESDVTPADALCSQTSEAAISKALIIPELEDLDSFNLIEPPPLDWKSDSSSEGDTVGEMDDGNFLQTEMIDTPGGTVKEPGHSKNTETWTEQPEEAIEDPRESAAKITIAEVEDGETPSQEYSVKDEDHTQIQELLVQLQLFQQSSSSKTTHDLSYPAPCLSVEEGISPSVGILQPDTPQSSGLLFSESDQKDLLRLLECEEVPGSLQGGSLQGFLPSSGEMDAVVSVSYSQEDGERFWDHFSGNQVRDSDDLVCEDRERDDLTTGRATSEEETASVDLSDMSADCHPAYKDVPGPCDPEDLLDGVIFGAKYLGSTQLLSEKNPSTNARMAQAQEAVDRIKAPEGESQPMTEVDLFISTQRIKVLSADTQEAMMDHPLQMISYIADIGSIVVLMARRKPAGRKGPEGGPASGSSAPRKDCRMICHVFSSEDAQTIAQAIGQAFGVAYQQFLHVSGIKAHELRPSEYSDYLGTQELYNGDLVHFSCSENIREVCISKTPGEILGLAVVESGWGSILPTVVVANLLHGGPAELSGELSIGDRIMSVNGTSLVGLPITTCHGIIRDLKNQPEVKLSIVHCPPVTMAIIKRPDPKYQLGFSVEDGIICSLMRGGIAERGGIRVGHRIIEINGQSVVATPHEKIIHILTHAVGEIHLKTMPASTYRLLTGQEQPTFL